MSDVDLDWLVTQLWPGDPTLSGYVPHVGEHITCYRPTDGAVRCGTVDENRAGLFLTCCDGRRRVLTAANWAVTPTVACPTTGQPTAGSSR